MGTTAELKIFFFYYYFFFFLGERDSGGKCWVEVFFFIIIFSLSWENEIGG